MYLHTVSDQDSGSLLEEAFDGRSLSKLNLCDDRECPHSRREAGLCGLRAAPWLCSQCSKAGVFRASQGAAPERAGTGQGLGGAP